MVIDIGGCWYWGSTITSATGVNLGRVTSGKSNQWRWWLWWRSTEMAEILCNVFPVAYLVLNVKRYGRIKTILSLLDPGKFTISIFPLLFIQYVGCLAFKAQQCSGCPCCHVSVGSGGVPSSFSSPKWVTESYRPTNIRGSTTRRASCLNILLFIQIIFHIFYDDYWLSMHTYGIHCLFDIFFVL